MSEQFGAQSDEETTEAQTRSPERQAAVEAAHSALEATFKLATVAGIEAGDDETELRRDPHNMFGSDGVVLWMEEGEGPELRDFRVTVGSNGGVFGETRGRISERVEQWEQIPYSEAEDRLLAGYRGVSERVGERAKAELREKMRIYGEARDAYDTAMGDEPIRPNFL